MKPNAPRSIGGVLDDSIRLYRAGFARVWPLALGAQLLVALPTFYFRLQHLGSGNVQAALQMYQSPGFWLPYAVGTLAAAGFFNAVTLRLAAVFQGQALSERHSLAAGFRLLPRVVLLILTLSVCAVAVALLFALAFFVPMLMRFVLSIAAVVLIIYLAGRVYLANPALVIDDLGVFKSIETAWVLTRGHWWRGATIYTVILLIGMVFYLIIAVAVGLVTVAFGRVSTLGAGLTQLLSVLGGSVILPLISASLVAIYFDFKLRIEGADLATRVNALAAQ